MNKLALVCLQTTLSWEKVNKSIMRANTWKSNSTLPFFLLKHVPTSSEMFLFPADRSPQTLHEYSRTCQRKKAAMTVTQPLNDFIINPMIPLCLWTMSTCTWGSSQQIPNDNSPHSTATATYWTAKQWIYPICPLIVKIYMHKPCFL